MLRLGLAVNLAILTVATASAAAQTPQATHAVGFYDPTLQRVVLVGGSGQARAGRRDRVWSWTGAGWEPVTDSGPGSRSNGAGAYDERRQMAVVTGGARQSATDTTAFEIIGDTWEVKSGGWERIGGTDISPRDHNAVVYDETRQAVIMFGGILAERSAAWPTDTWELGLGGWTRIATDGPSARGRTALAYDRARRQVVLFGGVGAPSGPSQDQPFFNDTWVLDRTGWRKVAEQGPRARYAHGMVFDERAGKVLMYSGAAAHRNAPLTDMWQWDGSRWTEIRLTGPTPGFRYQPVMVYDRARGKTVLYGGAPDGNDDTWEWDGRRWARIVVGAQP